MACNERVLRLGDSSSFSFLIDFRLDLFSLVFDLSPFGLVSSDAHLASWSHGSTRCSLNKCENNINLNGLSMPHDRARPHSRTLSTFCLVRFPSSSFSRHCSVVVVTQKINVPGIPWKNGARHAKTRKTGCVYLAVIRPSAERLRRSSCDKRRGKLPLPIKWIMPGEIGDPSIETSWRCSPSCRKKNDQFRAVARKLK